MIQTLRNEAPRPGPGAGRAVAGRPTTPTAIPIEGAVTPEANIYPIVSIAIPNKNRFGLLTEALLSLQAQTYPHWEAIVVDDRSEGDGMATVRRRFADDNRIHLLAREGDRGGAPVCRNQAYRASQGKYVVFLDSDDLLAPFCLEQRVAVMEADPSLDFAAFPSELFAECPGDLRTLWNTVDGPHLPRFLRWDVPWQTTGPIWRHKAIDRFGGWDESLPGWQDFEWHLRALLQGARYTTIDRRDNFVRRHPASTDNISQKGNTPPYLEARVLMFGRIAHLMRSVGALTSENQALLIGWYLYIARLWILIHGDYETARKVWGLCESEGLVLSRDAAAGRLALRYLGGSRWFWERSRLPVVSVWNRYASRRWPGWNDILRSTTMNAAPAYYDEEGMPLAA